MKRSSALSWLVALLASLTTAGAHSCTPRRKNPAPAPAPARALQVAVRLARPASELVVQRRADVIVSDGWGCADFDSEEGRIRQCWDAGPQPRAWTVGPVRPWHFVGRDRVCERDDQTLTFRCWERPRRGLPWRETPTTWEWLNPHGASPADTSDRSDRLANAVMGPTFACLRAKRTGVFCLGDDRFGQLGSSAPPRPDSGDRDPAWLRGILWDDVSPALGTWHGCGLALPERREILCWGRGDHGQLGAPAPDRCMVDGRPVPCARTPILAVDLRDARVILRAGDLFTCVSSNTGIRCWGANRDGLFGVRGSCPQSLRRAWPTLDGEVTAPHASCTTTPVDLPGTTEFSSHFEVSPRQICYESKGETRCLSGVPKPRNRQITRYRVSPGSDASACAIDGQSVVCWGEKYSPAKALDQPVTVALEPLPPLGDLAIVGGTDASNWKERCRIRQMCPNSPVRKLSPCQSSETGRRASEILAMATSLEGQTVRVRGPLGLGTLAADQVGILGLLSCETCCKLKLSAPIAVGTESDMLPLAGLGCSGDESRACCDAPAYGQIVIATGRLERVVSKRKPGPDWELTNFSVCEEPAAR